MKSSSKPAGAAAAHPGAVPADYHEVLYWQITQSGWRLTVVNLLSLPMAALWGFVFFGWAALLNRMPQTLEARSGEMLSLLAALLVIVVLHEVVHGLAMYAYGARPKFGILWQGMMLYATAPGYAFRRNEYIVVILAPLVSLSLAAFIGIAFAPTQAAVIMAVCATVNGAGAVGDLWIMSIALRYPKHAYVIDERDGMRVFLPA
jgi:hypothetical protein